MTEGKIYKAIKSDPGLLVTLVFAIGGVVWQYANLSNKIDNIGDALSVFIADSKSEKTDQRARDDSQDTKIVQNSVNIANIQGSLNQRGITVRQFTVRPVESDQQQIAPTTTSVTDQNQ